MQTTLRQHLGLQDYLPIWQQMQQFTQQRTPQTPDEIWVLEHLPVFTQGQAGKAEHVLNPGDIPVIQTDRGGQVTYHGPGQLVVYTLLDLNRLQLNIRQLVSLLENSMIAVLADFQIQAYAKKAAPGVYVDEQKIGAIGLRVRQGYSYHGLAFNIDNDLEPYQRINPCGYQGQQVTRLRDLLPTIDRGTIEDKLLKHLLKNIATL